jgi:ATP-dependent DNA helicase RecG
LEEIRQDLGKEQPMQRLLQGDVGAGKTVIAAAAGLMMIEAGYQVAIMAPTEILAEQHQRNLRGWFEPLAIDVVGLTGKQAVRQRHETQQRIASGQAMLIVGTHALFQEPLSFPRLGLIIVDEQHRFGVDQRLALRQKGLANGVAPHQLIMTATPIPRTLAQTFYADLDVSVLDELPPGRSPIDTVAVPESRRSEVVERVHQASREGRQSYWVCPVIEESEVLNVQNATTTFEQLKQALVDIEVGLIHGRLSPKEKEQIMARFQAGDIRVLVATTVIEVGVDVTRASLMIIENAERLGLSQLHQLRGRVGRGAVKSACVLLYKQPLSDMARERLDVMRRTNDGFEIARKDLEMRGPGELLGTRQTGEMMFHIADLMRHQALLPEVQNAAALLIERHPQAVDPIIRRWLGSSLEYAEI